MARLWLIGGTQESRELVQRLVSRLSQSSHTVPSPACLVTVTTTAARALYPQSPHLQVQIGQLTAGLALDLVIQSDVRAILDLSHPFAIAISQRAIAIAQRYQLSYLRYERPTVAAPSTPWRDHRDRAGLVCLPQLQDLLTEAYLERDRTLLTLGYRQLSLFASWQSRATLFARILPSPMALKTALQAGFTPDRLIALRPPISAELETALWRQWQITQIVTKASGTPGGQDQKQALAATEGVRLLQIMRPKITYPNQTDDLDTALQFAVRYCSH
ncbi:MAG: cobalt-precorrin-6A reductase [Cyanobacteria bacterium P01_C01_bin.147]